MDTVETVVIGAGVVGLAVARALALQGREVVLVEREAAIGQGISSRNSEVIHAGLYYPSGSLKARLCVHGKEMLYAYAAERHIPHARCGKLVVATDDAQIAKLQAIAAQAAANGVPVEWLTREQALALEPQLHCVAALHSPSTGIVDSHALMLSLLGDFENAGGVLSVASEVVKIDVLKPNASTVQVFALSVATKNEVTELHAQNVVNAAGLFAVPLAGRTAGLAAAHVPQARYAKGNYFSLSGKSPFSRLIYPVPEPGGLGTHLTLDMGGQAKFGPDVQWLPEGIDPANIDYAVDETRAESFAQAVRRYWPGLPDGGLQPSYSGVRPKISGPSDPAADFVISGPKDHGIPGLMNLFGMESPGLTCALAIGEEVATRLTLRA